MTATRRNTLLLLAALLISVMGGVAPTMVAGAEPWLSIAAVACAAAVGILLRRDMTTATPAQRKALQGQARALVLFLTAGVVTAFQWLLAYKQFREGFDPRAILQVVGLGLFALGVLQVGLAGAIAFRPTARPKPPAPDPEPAAEAPPPLPASPEPPAKAPRTRRPRSQPKPAED